ncbi:MAG: nucleoside-diphosphate-sugar epimerase [Halioglobus sp.]|jgi:nucleoside-diphosphate-sugar epimerase
MLIAGCGYIGERVATEMLSKGEAVSAIVRSDEGAKKLRTMGVCVLQLDLDTSPAPLASTLNQAIFYFAPPPPHGALDTRMQSFLERLAVSGQPTRIVYISTTGVYGDCSGNWIDETQPANPQVDRARRRWHAEQLLQDWRTTTGGELVILRVAGIYGPGKLPLARLQKGLPIVAEKHAPWTNRIHADDLVQVCLAAMARGIDGEVYNVCDGTPGNMTDYFNRVADLAGLRRPPLIDAEQALEALSPGLLSYLSESRRIRNQKMLDQLGEKLRYPSLEEGLPSCFSTA